MKNVVLFAMLLAIGLVLSAWMGVNDSRRGPARAANLNNSQPNPILKDGEVLIWDPNLAPAPHFAVSGNSPPIAVGAKPERKTPIYPEENFAPIYEPAHASHQFYQETRRLIRLARQLGFPRPDDWRSLIREPEQDFGQFVNESRRARGILVVQPIGGLPVDQKRAIGHLLDSLSAFFGMQAVCASPINPSDLPARCFSQVEGRRRINAEALISLVLKPLASGKVSSVLAITDMEIYPGDDWPFVSAFGWSSFKYGASVVSTAGVLEPSRAARGRNLLRLAKLCLHETSHTFALKHCSRFNCLMNGSGNLRESDSKPLSLCPDCLAKLSLVTGRKPGLHLEDMLGLCRAKGFSSEVKYYQSALRLLKFG
ncbi:MAG: archaemetzincin [Planctomycetota bacterium]|jgi:archaemetzincin|nr:archaemetzincin [Planctomycetota bacterium]